MPIYEFRCKECSSKFKKLVRSTSSDSVQCPTCRTSQVMRLLSVTANATGKDPSAEACCMPIGGG